MSTDTTEPDVRLQTGALRAALREKFPLPEYALFFEVADATGFRGSRTADAIAMSCWPSRGLDLIGFELKASRSDWTREKADPAKAEAICRYCDRWYLVIGDRKIVKPGELPPTWGLIAPKGQKLVIVTEAPKLNPVSVDRDFLAALLRKAVSQSPDEAVIREAVNKARAEGVEAGKRYSPDASLASKVKSLEDELKRLRETVATFEKHSGISLAYSWNRAHTIGEAVRFVMNGGLNGMERSAREAETLGNSLIRTVEEFRRLRSIEMASTETKGAGE